VRGEAVAGVVGYGGVLVDDVWWMGDGDWREMRDGRWLMVGGKKNAYYT